MMYLVVTNNCKTEELLKKTMHQVVFIDGTVQDVIRKCEDILLQGNYALAADLLAGRNVRPFPCLSVVMESRPGGAGEYDWIRLADYAVLDQRRRAQYENLGERGMEDYRILDRSLIKATLDL